MSLARPTHWLLTASTLSILYLALGCHSGEPDVASGGADPDRVLESGMTARQAMEARSLRMKDLGGAFKAVRDQLDQDNPNRALLQLSAQEVAYASVDLPQWFPEGTGPDTGVETDALAAAWTDAEGFASASRAFRESAELLHQASTSGDLERMREHSREVARTCKGCHDEYRADED